MSNKKPIDRLFQEKFKDFEAKPNASVWAGIQNKMEQPKEKTKVRFPVWLRFASVAAVLALVFTVGKFSFNNNAIEENNSIIVDSETNTDFNTDGVNNNNTISGENKNTPKNNNTSALEKSESLNNTTIVVNKSDSKNNSASKENNLTTQFSNKKGVSNKQKLNINTLFDNKNNNSKTTTNNSVAKNSEKSDNINTSNNSQRRAKRNLANTINTTVSNSKNSKNTITNNNVLNNASNNNSTDNSNSTINRQNPKTTVLDNNNTTATTAVATTDNEKEKEKMMEPDSANSSNTIDEALAKIENLDEKEDKINRWTVNPNAAPVYYNTLGKGSHIDQQFIDNPKNGEINSSYGVKVGYNVNNRLKVRSGINKLNLSYDTANVIVYNSVSNTPNKLSLRSIDFIPDKEGQTFSVLSTDNLTVQQVSSVVNDNINAALSQHISYIEVPLELEYTLVNKKFGVNVIGGASAFFLSDNEVISEISNQKQKIGEANNINDISYSTNIGLGIDYKFNNKLKFNFEPTFKYQMNTYSETFGNFKPYIIGLYTGFSYKF